MRSSGAILREVGCTNRTHLRDYEAVINEQTALLLRVHTSIIALSALPLKCPPKNWLYWAEAGIPVMETWKRIFVDMARFGLHGEPTVAEVMQTGVDVVTFSGDKLLGGPQAGVILGRKEIVAACRKTRSLGPARGQDDACRAGSHLAFVPHERQALEKVPTLRMIAMPWQSSRNGRSIWRRLFVKRTSRTDCRSRCNEALHKSAEERCRTRTSDLCGGGELARHEHAPIEAGLRNNKPPIIGRIESDQYLMDVRTCRRKNFLSCNSFSTLLKGPAPDEE